MKNCLLIVGIIGLFITKSFSQCSSAIITVTNQPGGQVDFTITDTIPVGWASTTNVNYGDFTTGNFTGNTHSHVYSVNSNYTATFYIHYYNILDTTINCTVYASVNFSVSNGTGYTETCNLNYHGYQHCMDSVLFELDSLPTLSPGYYYYNPGPIVLSGGSSLSNPWGIPLGYTPWPDSAGFVYELYYGSTLVCVDTSWSPVPQTIMPFGLDVMVDYNSTSQVELNDTSSTNMLFKNCSWGDGITQNNIHNYSATHNYLLDGDYTVIANSYPSYLSPVWIPYYPSCLTYDTVVVSITGMSNSLSCNLNPVVNYVAGTNTLNFGLYSGSTLVSSPNLNVNWSFNNGTNSTLDFGTFTGVVTPPTAFTVTYDIYDYGGSMTCTNNSTMAVNNFYPPCNALVYIFEDTITPGLFWAVDQSSGGLPSYSYLWDFGDGTTSSLQFPIHTYTIPDWYYVCLTITDSQVPPCVSTYCDSVDARAMDVMYQINVYNPDAIGIEEISEEDVSLFPNPAYNTIYLHFKNVFKSDVIISVIDITGQETNLVPNFKNDLIEIDLENLSPGIYFVKLFDATNSATKKFIKN